MDFEEVLHTWRAIAGAGVPVEVRVSGGSMRPLLTPGTILTVLPCAPGDLRVGDVVVARAAGGRVVAHRLVGRRGADLILRGDALGAADPPVAAPDVLGRAVALRRGAFTVDLDTPAARAAGLVLTRASFLARGVNVLRPVAVRAVELSFGTAPVRWLRRPRRLDTAVMLPGPAERPLLRALVLDAGAPGCLPGPDAEGTIAVAIARGLAVGCAWRTGERLAGVYVRPGWRRLGIGRTLLEVAVGDADEPVTAPAPHDARAEGLYRELGFAPSPMGEWTRRPVAAR
jgi:GNAT superfamily N-acetyltransferase